MAEYSYKCEYHFNSTANNEMSLSSMDLFQRMTGKEVSKNMGTVMKNIRLYCVHFPQNITCSLNMNGVQVMYLLCQNVALLSADVAHVSGIYTKHL